MYVDRMKLPCGNMLSAYIQKSICMYYGRHALCMYVCMHGLTYKSYNLSMY